MENNNFIDFRAEMQELKKLTLIGAKDTLTLSEAALYLGVTKSHLYKLCMQRAVPFYKGAGGKFSYFDKKELDGWAKSRRIATTDEGDSKAASYIVKHSKHGGK